MSKVKILVLDRGWVLIGETYESDKDILLKNASCIQRWGTTDGLGQLAKYGKQENTILKPFHDDLKINKSFVMMIIDCDDGKWS